MDMILKNTFRKVSPSYTLLADITVATSTTRVDINGLNIGKDDELLLVSDISHGGTFSPGNYAIFVNNTTLSGSNYFSQSVTANGGGVSGFRGGGGALFSTNAYTRGLSIIKIKLTNSGRFLYYSSSVPRYTDNGVMYTDACGVSSFGISSITTVSINTSAGNGIGAGSRFQLYKLVAEKVADIIVPSNMTSVNISGLNIGKDGEYYLASDIVGGADSAYYLYVNNNTTATNYYSQRMTAVGSSVNAGRTNSPIVLEASGTNKSFVMSSLKLTNSGYFVSQNSCCRAYTDTSTEASSAITLYKYYTTPTLTASAVTNLILTASAANGIGAGSRFQLYKMK